MTDYAIWTPKFDGDAPPNWKAGDYCVFRSADYLDWSTASHPTWTAGFAYQVKPEALATPFDYPTWAAQGRANRDKLPDAVAEALGPERDWALAVWREAFHAAMGSDVFSQDEAAAAVIRTRCRPINDTVTDEAVLEAAILEVWRSYAKNEFSGSGLQQMTAACRKHLAGLTFPETGQ